MSQRAVTAPRVKVARPLPKRRSMWRLLLLGIIIVILSSYISPVRSYYDRTQQIAAERSVTDELRRKHETLQAEKENLLDNAYVEQVARRDLGLVRPGEQPYVVKDLNSGQIDEGDQVEMSVSSLPQRSFVEGILARLGELVP